MPCMCWFDPGDDVRRVIKLHCQIIVDVIKQLEKEGDPICVSLEGTKKLLDHLYDTSSCD